MQEINNLRQRLLRLILACHILERNTGLFLYIYFGIALADTHYAASAAHALHHHIENDEHRCNRKHPLKQKHDNTACRVHFCLFIGRNTSFIQLLLQIRIVDRNRVVLHSYQISVFSLAAAIFLRIFLRRDLNLSIANHNRFYLVILKHLIKLAVRHLVRAAALPEVVHHRHAEKRKQHRHDQHCIILTAGIFSIFILVSLIIHTLSPFCVTVHPESATSGYSKAPLNLPHLLLIRLHARFSSPSAHKFLRTLIHYSGRLPINQEVKILKTCELLIKYRCFLCIYEMPSKSSAV